MAVAFKAGDTAYIVENNRIVRECTIVRESGNLYIITEILAAMNQYAEQ